MRTGPPAEGHPDQRNAIERPASSSGQLRAKEEYEILKNWYSRPDEGLPAAAGQSLSRGPDRVVADGAR